MKNKSFCDSKKNGGGGSGRGGGGGRGVRVDVYEELKFLRKFKQVAQRATIADLRTSIFK